MCRPSLFFSFLFFRFLIFMWYSKTHLGILQCSELLHLAFLLPGKNEDFTHPEHQGTTRRLRPSAPSSGENCFRVRGWGGVCRLRAGDRGVG